MMTKEQLVIGLQSFYGTEKYHNLAFGLKMTDGVKWLCDNAGFYWFTDIIASYQEDKRVKNDTMLQVIQFWKFNCDIDNNRGTVILERDMNDIKLKQEVELTDFPLETITLYYSPMDKVIFLPSEY